MPRFDLYTIESLCCLLNDTTLMQIFTDLGDCSRNETLAADANGLRATIWPYLAERVNGAQPQ